jgi:hypothetical protein
LPLPAIEPTYFSRPIRSPITELSQAHVLTELGSDKLLLVLASTIILDGGSRGNHDQIHFQLFVDYLTMLCTPQAGTKNDYVGKGQ